MKMNFFIIHVVLVENRTSLHSDSYFLLVLLIVSVVHLTLELVLRWKGMVCVPISLVYESEYGTVFVRKVTHESCIFATIPNFLIC